MMSLRLPDDLVPLVQAVADEEERTFTDALVRLVRAGLSKKTLLVESVRLETPAEAAQVPRVLKETRDNLPGPRPAVKEDDYEEPPNARAANRCTHGNDLKFCTHCRIFTKKYGNAGKTTR
jgi:hypothetical protein